MIEIESFGNSKNQLQDQTRGSIIKKKVEIEIEEGSFEINNKMTLDKPPPSTQSFKVQFYFSYSHFFPHTNEKKFSPQTTFLKKFLEKT